MRLSPAAARALLPFLPRRVFFAGFDAAAAAALRVFGTYQVNASGMPEKIVVRAYHRDSAKAPWRPSDASVHSTLEEMEEEIKDWERQATAAGYKKLSKRIGAQGKFNKDSIPVPPTPPKQSRHSN